LISASETDRVAALGRPSSRAADIVSERSSRASRAVERADVRTRLATLARRARERATVAAPRESVRDVRTRALNADNKNARIRALEGRVEPGENGRRTAPRRAHRQSMSTFQALLAARSGRDKHRCRSCSRCEARVVEVIEQTRWNPSTPAGGALGLEELDRLWRARRHCRRRRRSFRRGDGNFFAIAVVGAARSIHRSSTRRADVRSTHRARRSDWSISFEPGDQSRAKERKPPNAPPSCQGARRRAFRRATRPSTVHRPRAAVLAIRGKAWVYDQTGDEEFTRREIDVARTDGRNGWFADRQVGGESGASIVTAQL